MNYPTTINDLIECFKKFPTIGEKSAERLALATIEMPEEVLNLFSESLKNVNIKIKKCSKCNNLTEETLCTICKDDSRNSDLLCIVESVKDINLMEKNNIYNGRYFVLQTLISPQNGLDPNSIDFEKLESIIKKDKVKEVIIAIKPTVEGETTALYINKVLQSKKVLISRIALGIPMGAEIDYVDSLTLEMAIENRKIISEN